MSGILRPAKPYGLGMRVPMLAISPWSKGGWVCSEVFDHPSVIRFLERRFNVACPNITAWRRTVCGDLTSAFDFSRPSLAPSKGLPADQTRALPDQSQFVTFKAGFDAKPAPVAPHESTAPKVEPGVRPYRPLGYQLSVKAWWRGGGVTLSFENAGVLGAAFAVTDLSQTHLAPRRYTVEAQKSLTDVVGRAVRQPKPDRPGTRRIHAYIRRYGRWKI
jgi:phospholipase C